MRVPRFSMFNFLKKKQKPVPQPVDQTEMFSSEDLLQDIAHHIVSYGQHFPKKHGEWVCLAINLDEFFAMDTWNGSIAFKSGKPNYEYWTGFPGSTMVEYLGLSSHAWRGSDKLPLEKEKYEKYLLIIQDYVLKYKLKQEQPT